MSHISENRLGNLFATLRGKWVIPIASAVVGCVGTIVISVLTDFWEFRERNHKIILQQYNEVLEYQVLLDARIDDYNKVFEGQKNVEANVGEYSQISSRFLSSISNLSTQLPAITTEHNNYAAELTDLDKYYSVSNPPVPDSMDWLIFYGNFRADFDEYRTARDRYLAALQDQMNDYTYYLNIW